MTGLEKRLARSNPRYGMAARVDLISRGAAGTAGAARGGEEWGSLGTPREKGPRALSGWLRLLKAHNLVLREVRRDLGGGTTLPQFDVLAQLAREPEGLTLVDLSRRLLVTAGNLTGIVARLQRDGLVRREEDPRDRRAFRVRLSGRGRGRIRNLIPRHAKLMEQLFDGLSAGEQDELRELLGRLGDTIAARGVMAGRRRH